jgi:uncharacterized protein YqeY
MSLLETITAATTTAMKQKDAVALTTLRGLKSRIQNEVISSGGELSDTQVIALVRSEVKRRADAIALYEQGGRAELADNEKAEVAILQQFLPAQLDEAQVASAIDKLVAANSWTAKEFGAAMSAVKAELGDTADGALIAKLLKARLS